jgi:outer membrane protein assembly factor BamA
MPTATSQTAPPKVVIEHIDFDGPIHLADSAVTRIIAEFNNEELTTNKAWLDQFVEIGLRGAWQNEGYYRVKPTAEARSLGGDSDEEHFAVTAHVEEGLRYHLGELRFVNVRTGAIPVFPESQLQHAFPMQPGEFFDVSRVRDGIQALARLYGSQGYSDFTATPKTEIDDNLQRISLVMALDEQTQFRVNEITLVGLEPALEARLKSVIRTGEVFDAEVIKDLLEQNRGLLPQYWSFNDDLQLRRNVRAGTVDVVIDVRPCPPLNSR